ncbi:MAG: polyprenyl diphosphate synthase, partial [Clostridiales bacterium]
MNMFKDFFSAKNQSQPDISKDNWDSLSQEELIDLLNKDNLPRHIAIIMDGNGRWAKAHNLPRQMGHRKGAETLRRVLECAQSISVETITVYAFSTENWKRSAEEVGFLMDLLLEYLIKELKTFHEAGIKVIPLGDIDGLPEKVCHEFVKVREDTKNNLKMTLNIAVNYGSRKEIA